MKKDRCKTQSSRYGKWGGGVAVALALVLSSCGATVEQVTESVPVSNVSAGEAEADLDAGAASAVEPASDGSATSAVEPASDGSATSATDPTITDPAEGIAFFEMYGVGIGVMVPGSFEQSSYDDYHTTFDHAGSGISVFVGALDEPVNGSGSGTAVPTWSDIMRSEAVGDAQLYIQGEQNGDAGSVRAVVDAGGRGFEVLVTGSEQFAQPVFDQVIRDLTIIDADFWGDGQAAAFENDGDTDVDTTTSETGFDTAVADFSYGFYLEMLPGFVPVPVPLGDGDVHIFENREAGVRVKMYGTQSLPEPGEQIGTFPLAVDVGGEPVPSSEVPLWQRDQGTEDGAALIITSIETVTHWVVAEIDGPVDGANDTQAAILASLLVFDPQG